jgi:hypothetical protein
LAAEDYSDLIAAAEDYSDLTAAAPARPQVRTPKPRSFTASDDELGIGTGMQPNQIPAVERVKRGIMMGGEPGQGSPFDFGTMSPQEREAGVQAGRDFYKKHGRPQDPMEADPMAQSVALTALLGPFGRLAAAKMAPTVGAVPASVSTGAAEAYLGAKSSGSENAGDAALFGGVFGGLGARGGTNPNPAAIAKNDAQLTKDIKRGATKAPKAMADDVDFRADQLIESSKDAPEVRKALVTQSRSNPAAAEGVTQKTLAKDVADNDAVFKAIEQHHGGVDLQLVTDRLARLEAQYRLDGDIPGMTATGKIIDTLNSNYGGNAGSTLNSAQLRKLRNDLGDLAFPGIAKEARPSGAKEALRDVYNEFNGAIEEIASVTPGVDVGALKARNSRISSLMPARKALGARAELEADRELGFVKGGMDKLKKGATGINRRLRYAGETVGQDNPLLMAPPSYGPLDNLPTYEERPPSPLLPQSQSALAARLLLNGRQ